MTKGPAVVIIARHGARLDAADKTWHLTSPTPYDPPLTYGGWTQAKALGLRIASLLHAREQDNQHLDSSHLNLNGVHSIRKDDGQRAHGRRRKQKIIIHSSPYLRCIQTSTAIAAGISQFHPKSHDHIHTSRQNNGDNGNPSGHRLAPLDTSVSPFTTPSSTTSTTTQTSSKPRQPAKILLRIDAFLGEWLSPDYFEDITPPPNSTMMVAGAKADLLRRGDYVEEQQVDNSNKGHFPGGWAKNNGNSAHQSGKQSAIEETDSPLSSMGSLAQALHMRERASSSGANGIRPGNRGTPPLSTAHKVPSHIYDPPVPVYALSPAEPIPRGYVTHARDACLDVDYLWDSIREPQEWGDGGEYGDEWSTMHRRFRKGLAAMTRWYKENGAVRNYGNGPPPPADESDDEEEEIVLILVTHGAGCNALLGAISNQPVLMDVGLASLSMAVRKDDAEKRTTTPPVLSMRRPSVIDTHVPEEYKLKIMASIDHLRPGVDPAKLPELASPLVTAKPSLESRRRFSPVEYPFPSVDPFKAANSSLGSIRRPSTSGSSSRMASGHNRSNTSASPKPGLWSRPPNNSDSSSRSGDSQEQGFGLNFGPTKPRVPKTGTDTALAEKDNVPPLPTAQNRSTNQYGLWGPPVALEQNERRPGPKRRWTVTDAE